MPKISHSACHHQKLCMSRRTDRHIRRTPGTLCCPLTSARGYLLSPVLFGHPSLYFHSFPSLGTLDSMNRCIDSILHTSSPFTFFLPIAHAWKKPHLWEHSSVVHVARENHAVTLRIPSLKWICVTREWGTISYELTSVALWVSLVSQKSCLPLHDLGFCNRIYGSVLPMGGGLPFLF